MKTKHVSGRLFPIINRKKGAEQTDACPYCGQRHIHGYAEGHRSSHCTDKSIEVTIDGFLFKVEDGYVIKEYE